MSEPTPPFLLSPNLITDKEFKSYRVNREPISEVNQVVKNAINKPELQSSHQKSAILDPEARKNEFSITLKIFLKDFDTLKAQEAIDQILEILGTEYVENLNLALPEMGCDALGFTSDNVDPNTTSEHRENLIKLWRFLEKLVDRKVIKNLGISDVETEVFKYIFNNVKIKPNNVQVNQTTCCVVPPELKIFAKDNDVHLLTHNDPPIIWNPKCESLQKFNLRWIIRSLVHIEARGVLKDKRYAISLE
ncbi:GCLM [Lepeophtheirus salmonis]|uniref:GCS light chain n=1 Tax=Lepeophtheirus salmonis TaxID=72036 RepID=A0A0K2UKE9_LEPSM|nr:GCLM [Lepeophtheirus salmonis]CAF2770631.1 GCLM [Lepeophtheirus salmonis]